MPVGGVDDKVWRSGLQSLASAELEAAGQGWVYWDLTIWSRPGAAGELENDGVRLKLADQQEDYDSSGPALPSSRYPDPEVRPRLTVWYWN